MIGRRDLPPVLRAWRKCSGAPYLLAVYPSSDLCTLTWRQHNICGTNIDLFELVKSSGLELVQGDPQELNGFPSFDPERVLANLASYQYGTLYPALAQALVLQRKPACA